jgi:TonB-dependent Receptor Plug Domain.
VVEWDPQLTRFISLDSVRIIARRSRYPEFSRNRRSPMGKFFDEEAIAQRNAFRTTDLLGGVAGVRLVPNPAGYGDIVTSTRGSGWSSRCVMSVVIDGVQGEDINDIMPSEIGAMEVYSSPIGAPPQYVRGDCGVIVIWTKR